LKVDWEVHVADFPEVWLASDRAAEKWAKPDAILFDAFSPAKNPAMWTLPLFRRIFDLLDPRRPCAMPTYSRSTMLRVTLLLAGFFVGAGRAIAEKEETTIAANDLSVIERPLGADWLEAGAELDLRGAAKKRCVSEGAARVTAVGTRVQRHPQFA
jgi:tRNA U34 5-methylaminomethyl-2-thiouridine-forming methyltransferase MnmC